MSVDEAVERADVLVLAVWLDSFKQLIAQYGERLAGKVIVDPSNPVAPDGDGGFGRSSASRSPRARSWPTCCCRARLVKAFGMLSADTLSAPHGGGRSARCCSTPPPTTLRAPVADLIRTGGYEPVRWVAGRPSALRCSATCTNSALWAESYQTGGAEGDLTAAQRLAGAGQARAERGLAGLPGGCRSAHPDP